MITVQKAQLSHVEGICRVCSDGWRDTYANLCSPDYIENVIQEFYTPERITQDVVSGDYWVAVEDAEVVVGAGGGGMIGDGVGELFVLYVDPERRYQGIGTLLLDAITHELKSMGAREQWVSVRKDNMKGIPFYESRGFIYRGEREAYRTYGEDSVKKSLRYCRSI